MSGYQGTGSGESTEGWRSPGSFGWEGRSGVGGFGGEDPVLGGGARDVGVELWANGGLAADLENS